jgi:hypothetical protein
MRMAAVWRNPKRVPVPVQLHDLLGGLIDACTSDTMILYRDINIFFIAVVENLRIKNPEPLRLDISDYPRHILAILLAH